MASMGVEDSGSGALDEMVKRDAKKSIGVDVYVVRGLRCYYKLKIKISFSCSFIHFVSRGCANIAEDDIIG
jgi:hypothetical protein